MLVLKTMFLMLSLGVVYSQYRMSKLVGGMLRNTDINNVLSTVSLTIRAISGIY